MTELPTDVGQQLAAMTSAVRYEDLSPATIQAATEVLFDTLACAFGGLHAPGVPQVRDTMSTWGAGNATIWGTARTAPAPFAAVANAGALHALDYDDTDDAVPLHAAGVVLPALVADLQENRPNCHGHEFLTALAVGLDAAMRVGRAGGPKGSRGWNYSVVSGGMGAALALAHLRGWGATQTVDVLGHQLAQTSGSLQSIIDGTLAKRFQPALVAKNTIFAAALSAAGIDAPRNVFEGRAGFINLYQDGQFDTDVLLAEADSAGYLTDLSLKPYPACRFTHAPIDVALQIQRAGIAPDVIEHITFETSGQAFNMVGRPFDPATASIVDAQFCIAYTTTVALHRGRVVIGDFTEDALRDSTIGDFAADRISVQVSDDIDFLAMTPVSATVRLVDGTEQSFATKTVSGSPALRLSVEQLKAKASDCIRHGRVNVTADQLWDSVVALTKDAPVSDLLDVLAGPTEGSVTR